MNGMPPSDFDPEEDDTPYRRASDSDPSRPSEATRAAVHAHAERLAAERRRAGQAPVRQRRASWWPAAFGTLAAAALAALTVAPRLLGPRLEPAPSAPPAEVAVSVAPPPVVREAAPADNAGAYAPAAPAAPAPRREDAVVTQRARMQAKTTAESGSNAALTGRDATERDVTDAGRLPAPTAAQANRAAGATALAREALDPAGDLRRAAAGGDLATLGRLAGRPGTDIDARDGEGRTALMLATLNGRVDAVARLLALGADPNLADGHGATALSMAAASGTQPEILAALKRYGAR